VALIPPVVRRLLGRQTLAGGTTRPAMRPAVRQRAREVKGFLADAEGLMLFNLAAAISHRAACLEVGSYCGKSALYLGEGCRTAGCHQLLSVDHHRGSAEQQPGQAYFDPELYDEHQQAVTTLNAFIANLRQADLMAWVIPIVGSSAAVSRYVKTLPLGLVFIDGGHSDEDVTADVDAWSGNVIRGGYLCLHDVFPDPTRGGQAPYRAFRRLAASRRWRTEGVIDSLAVLERR
jgi:predicted O-methyltransferase YrrM